MNPLILRVLPYITGVLLLAGGVWYIHHDGYIEGAAEVQAAWDKEEARTVKEKLAAVESNRKTITELEVKYAKANTDLEYLRAHPAGRVRVPRTACPKVNLPDTTSGSAVPAPGAERASDPAQDAFGEAQQGMESDAIEWARALNACAVVMEWANNLAPE